VHPVHLVEQIGQQFDGLGIRQRAVGPRERSNSRRSSTTTSAVLKPSACRSMLAIVGTMLAARQTSRINDSPVMVDSSVWKAGSCNRFSSVRAGNVLSVNSACAARWCRSTASRCVFRKVSRFCRSTSMSHS
jgi:hypothetical protein